MFIFLICAHCLMEFILGKLCAVKFKCIILWLKGILCPEVILKMQWTWNQVKHVQNFLFYFFIITPTMKPVHDLSINLNVMKSMLKDCPISSVSQNCYLTKKIIRFVQCHGCEHQLYIDLCAVMGDVEHCCNLCIQLRLISDQTSWPH